MSTMLSMHKEAHDIIRDGGLVPDELVGDALLEQAFNPKHADRAGIIIDGFPRSESQVCIISLVLQPLSATLDLVISSVVQFSFDRKTSDRDAAVHISCHQSCAGVGSCMND
jgi:adenylate kinase family enzyme